ncbi:hypothetical protein BDR26DRAFT_474630 [Obelidium mucronatum]|nr:hypothetical protein BDR26DRAFT_474630 [Obelidium mucronatum]
MSDMSLWGYSSWWYWNQQAMKFAIDQINMDPSILPNTTIKIKRFNNNAYLDRQRASSPGASSPGAAMLVAQEIAIHHPDVIAVFGDFLPRDLAADAEVYSYFQIPQCAGSTLQSSMWDRNKYGYYFQTMALTGYAESIALTPVQTVDILQAFWRNGTLEFWPRLSS